MHAGIRSCMHGHVCVTGFYTPPRCEAEQYAKRACATQRSVTHHTIPHKQNSDRAMRARYGITCDGAQPPPHCRTKATLIQRPACARVQQAVGSRAALQSCSPPSAHSPRSPLPRRASDGDWRGMWRCSWRRLCERADGGRPARARHVCAVQRQDGRVPVKVAGRCRLRARVVVEVQSMAVIWRAGGGHLLVVPGRPRPSPPRSAPAIVTPLRADRTFVGALLLLEVAVGGRWRLCGCGAARVVNRKFFVGEVVQDLEKRRQARSDRGQAGRGRCYHAESCSPHLSEWAPPLSGHGAIFVI